MNWMVLPNQVCLIVKFYNNRPELLPDSNDLKIKILVFTQQQNKIINFPFHEILTKTI